MAMRDIATKPTLATMHQGMTRSSSDRSADRFRRKRGSPVSWQILATPPAGLHRVAGAAGGV